MGKWNIYHRDIKPDNIMIDFKSETVLNEHKSQGFQNLSSEIDFEVIIIDLGLSKEIFHLIEANSSLVGNYVYWAPEGKVDEDEGQAHLNSDIFSLAAMTVQILCPMKEKTYFYDYEEEEVWKHIEASLDVENLE